MKRFYGFILLLVMVLSLPMCTSTEKQGKGYLCKYFLVGFGKPRGDYLIEVTDSGVMTISSGWFSDDFYDKVLYEDKKMTGSLYDCDFFMETLTKETRRLTPAEFERLKSCISKIEDVKLVNPFVEYMWSDVYIHMILINENKSVFIDVPSEDFSEFLKTLLELTHKEWKNHSGEEIELDYDERWVYEGHRKKSCWERIKGWFE